jgi:hypothetical protein
MNMKKLIQKMTDIEAGKKMLNESVVDECGGMMPPAPQQQGNPVTVSVNFNASGSNNVMELLNLLKNSGLQGAAGASEPSQGMRMDMENFRNIVDTGNTGDDMDDIDMKFSMDDKTGIKGMSKAESSRWDNRPKPNEPNEIYADPEDVIPSGNDMHRSKKERPPVAGGGNPMAVKQESIDKADLKSRLLQALEEKKEIDRNGDGKNDWEDIKLARKAASAKATGKGDNDSKGSKPKKGKVPPQFLKKK